jgi:DNA-binding transcriptional ArsR family regulator
MKQWSDEIPVLGDGNIKEYVEKDLFGETIDDLNTHTDRKSVLGDSIRYSILYLVYKHETIPRKELSKATGKSSNGLQHHLRELLNNNMIAEVPAPDNEDGRMSYYRITKIGAQEIEADIKNITGDIPSNHSTKFVEIQRATVDGISEDIPFDYTRRIDKKDAREDSNVMSSADDLPEGFTENFQTNDEDDTLGSPSDMDVGETNAA